ncbi:hypothetical protein IP92_02404 [Pseudoduganella flava]|uniref:Uncharacterized protein n=1 Tax=Pseudoduganella flava TaxID=871742 RepID=A0A562PSC3_9BURK|nr:hypothetical protein [Pseudoduganella flava]QGZ39345.1 hypothetical protein GO485_09995 [Pseudoduganella flava]TWI47345.1 hypothetical protein IP92_02404 [Pseudoduganella flava]
MLEPIDELVFEVVGSLADKLSATFTGPSPYNGSLPFAFVLEVACDVVNDKFVVSIRQDSNLVSRITSPFSFEREAALCEGIASILSMKPHSTLAKLTGDLANYGYRFLSLPTGMLRGHTETVTVMADTISELDAALKLNSDPDCIFDLLDGGADPMRRHIKYGRPFEVARILEHMRDDYKEVVAYMRACGAH